MRFYTISDIGPKRAFTGEGFLLCKDVGLARTTETSGPMLYADGEIPVDSNGSGIISIHRNAADVFAENAINSFNGKPVTNDHPPEKVDPKNWKQYSVGTVLNPRRGVPPTYDPDILYADLLIHDEDAIKAIMGGKREVSAGYDAEYIQVSPGIGRQRDIVGNHVALVDRGRCGPRCAIGDRDTMATTTKDRKVATKDKFSTVMDALIKAIATHDTVLAAESLGKISEMFGTQISGPDGTGSVKKAPSGDADRDDDDDDRKDTKDEDREDDDKSDTKDAGADREDEEPKSESFKKNEEFKNDKATLDSISKSLSNITDRLGNLESAFAIMSTDRATKDEDEDDKEDKTEDKKTVDAKTKDEDEDDDDDDRRGRTDDRRPTTDASSLGAAFRDVISRAEILAPGSKPPTFDAKASVKATTDAMCKFRRRVLTDALKEDETRDAVVAVAGGKPDLKNMTCDAVAILFNNASNKVRDERSQSTGRPHIPTANSFHDASSYVASINNKNTEFWNKHSAFRR